MARARARVSNRMRRLGRRLGVAAALLGVVALAIFLRSEAMLAARHPVTPSSLRFAAAPDASRVERGRHLATEVAQCTFCHGPDLAGQAMVDDALLGRLYAPNLTPARGAVGERYSATDWVRAIRFGLRPDDRSLLLMPSEHLSKISDADLAAVIAFIRQVPAVERVTPSLRVGPMTRTALALGAAPELVAAARVDRSRTGAPAQTAMESPEYGRYLVDLANCRVCHKADLSGGLHPLSLPEEPPPGDLRRGGVMAGWTRGEFVRAMRLGRAPAGRQLDRAYMPWPGFAGLRDEELTAIWLYLQSLDGRDRAEAVPVVAARGDSSAHVSTRPEPVSAFRSVKQGQD